MIRFWLVRLINQAGEIKVDDPVWVTVTFGGNSQDEIKRQIEEALENVQLSQQGPPAHEMKDRNLEFDIGIIEFDAMGVARL